MSLVLEPLNSLGHFFPPSNYVLEPGDAPFPTGASFLPPLKRYAGWLQPGQLPIPKAIPLSHTHTLALEGCGTVPYLWTIVGGGGLPWWGETGKTGISIGCIRLKHVSPLQRKSIKYYLLIVMVFFILLFSHLSPPQLAGYGVEAVNHCGDELSVGWVPISNSTATTTATVCSLISWRPWSTPVIVGLRS